MSKDDGSTTRSGNGEDRACRRCTEGDNLFDMQATIRSASQSFVWCYVKAEPLSKSGFAVGALKPHPIFAQ